MGKLRLHTAILISSDIHEWERIRFRAQADPLSLESACTREEQESHAQIVILVVEQRVLVGFGKFFRAFTFLLFGEFNSLLKIAFFGGQDALTSLMHAPSDAEFRS